MAGDQLASVRVGDQLATVRVGDQLATEMMYGNSLPLKEPFATLLRQRASAKRDLVSQSYTCMGQGLMHPCLAVPQREAKGHEARPSEELGILVVSRVDP